MAYNFAWLAQKTTAGRSILKGALPPVYTILSLLVTSLGIATCAWLWAAVWGGVAANAVAFVPILTPTLLAVLGATLVNFWFNREITHFVKSARTLDRNSRMSQDENPTDLFAMVDHLHAELEQHFGRKLPKIPRLSLFNDDHFHIITVEGRNPGRSGLFFSKGSFHYDHTKMTQRHVAAIIQMEMVKIYLHRGVARTIVRMGTDLFSTLQNMSDSASISPLRWCLAVLAGPLQFFLLLERSLKRTYDLEAAEIVAKCGRGYDLYLQVDASGFGTQTTTPSRQDTRNRQRELRREPYDHTTAHYGLRTLAKYIFKPIADWVDVHEPAEDDKTGYRLVTLPDILVRDGGDYFTELFKEKNRGTNLKAHLASLVKATVTENGISTEISLDTAPLSQFSAIDRANREINRAFHNKIATEKRYAPIGPDSDGRVPPTMCGAHQHNDVPRTDQNDSDLPPLVQASRILSPQFDRAVGAANASNIGDIQRPEVASANKPAVRP